MRMKKARAAAAALLCAACLAQTAVPALAAEAYTAPDVTGKTLEQLMDDFRAEHALTGDNFEISFYVPETGEQYDFNETKMLYGASTYKLPLNLYYYDMQLAGEITGDTMITQGASLDEAHYQSLVYSNNELSYSLWRRIGDWPTYKTAMRKYFTMTDGEIPQNYYYDHLFCTRMMMDTLKYLYARQDEFPELIDYMKQSNPQNGYFKAKVTEMEVAHKYGSFEGAENDVGIFYAEHPFLLAVYTQNVGESVVQDAARLAADYNAQQTELYKQQALQAQLDAFEAEKQARLQDAEARAEQARLTLAAEQEAEKAAPTGDVLLLETEPDTEPAQTPAQPQEAESSASAFQFNPDNFEWWMLAVAAAVLLLGSGGVLLVWKTGKMKELSRDAEQDDEDSDDSDAEAETPKEDTQLPH